MSHSHTHCCEHEVAWCKVCDVVYCKKCGVEWKKSYHGGWYIYPETYTNIPSYTTTSGSTYPISNQQQHHSH